MRLFEKVEWDKLPNQDSYSWDFQKNAIEINEDSYDFVAVFEKENKIGYVIINPKTGTVAQFELVESGKRSDWLKLFSGIKNIVPTIKINNIVMDQKDKIIAIEKTGLRNYKAIKSNYKVKIEPSVKKVRPFTACAVIKNLKLE